MWQTPGYIPTLIAVACAFGSWSLLLPVVPSAVLDGGGGDFLAGATTGVFMAATVLTQIATPALLRRFGYNPVMMAAALILGLPSLGYLLGMSTGPALLFSAIRGVGFGALTVAESALVAELVPVRFLGQASGMLGVFVGLAQMLCLPLGLALAQTPLGYPGVYALAAVVGVLAGAMCLKIPRIKAARGDKGENAVPSASTWKLVTVPALAVTSISMGFGAVSSFLPAAVTALDANLGALLAGIMLAIVSGASMIFRFGAGVVADRRGAPGAMMIPGQILAGVGMVITAAVLFTEASAWWLVVAAVAFGGGFGVVQNEALLSMFVRLPRSKVSEASAIWNIAYDSGTGLGSFILGAVAARAAYSGAFATAAVLIGAGIAMTLADSLAGRHRITEHHNTRALLRQIPAARRAVQLLRRRR
ncbi:MFS transporter [Corynebacterium lowii]|uniref:Major Facilitator Superfamily protein n=1 Tax=Corynebacterium lowii TaxID=1544413 RepID=A0A0N8W0H4_9CORY|nr:MFS transporter [Corynebacterium lowii]KQB86706.1 Major Facilitator Superfamily protein [Corynebacterium lowii]MDP9851392.1 MFS family permease [Corynebacterium lowii]